MNEVLNACPSDICPVVAHNEILKYNFKGISLELELRDDAFKPTSTSEILASNALMPKNGILIEMGCGVCYIGILAAKLGARKVYAVDLSAEACELARKNAIRNHVEDIVEVRQGNLFEHLEGIAADVIIDDVSGIAGLIARNTEWYKNEKIPIASEDGSSPTIEMLQQAKNHLTERGRLYFPVLSIANEKKIIKTAECLFKYIEKKETRIFPLTGGFKESADSLIKLSEDGKIRLIKKGSRLCWELNVYEASNYREKG